MLVVFHKCYSDVVKKTVPDTVSKTIVDEMVNEPKFNFQNRLASKVYKSNAVKTSKILMKSARVAAEQAEVHDQLAACQNALNC